MPTAGLELPPGSAGPNRSVAFFDAQFRRQIAAQDFTLNPFEEATLPFLRGEVLDLGCGLGNLALAAARRGCRVTAVDASPAAIAHLARAAAAESLAVSARRADLGSLEPILASGKSFDAVVCIGLLVFLAPGRARAAASVLRRLVKRGGVAAVNVLVEGTTFLEMFEPGAHCLFGARGLARYFPKWENLYFRVSDHPAPGGTVKRFCTLVARR